MAGKTLVDADNLLQICSDMLDVKQALTDLGVEILSGTPSSQYGNLIREFVENLPAKPDWGNHQAMGERRDYSYAFAEWQNAIISPEYSIIAEEIRYCFKNCVNLARFEKLIRVVGQNPSVEGICMGCENLEISPTIKFTPENNDECLVVENWDNAYAGCGRLKNVVVDFGTRTNSDTTGGEVRNSMQNTFQGCVNLETISFKGFGSPFKLDLSDCSKLESESVENLSNHLLDVTSKDGDFRIAVPYHLKSVYSISNMEELGWKAITKHNDTYLTKSQNLLSIVEDDSVIINDDGSITITMPEDYTEGVELYSSEMPISLSASIPYSLEGILHDNDLTQSSISMEFLNADKNVVGRVGLSRDDVYGSAQAFHLEDDACYVRFERVNSGGTYSRVSNLAIFEAKNVALRVDCEWINGYKDYAVKPVDSEFNGVTWFGYWFYPFPDNHNTEFLVEFFDANDNLLTKKVLSHINNDGGVATDYISNQVSKKTTRIRIHGNKTGSLDTRDVVSCFFYMLAGSQEYEPCEF